VDFTSGEVIKHMKKQVQKSHYEFNRYLNKQRWSSIWHQLDEIIRLSPSSVLEVGPGPGVVKATAQVLGIRVETLDIDPDLNPDHTCSVFDMPFEDGDYDVVCAFQMLEHLPFEKSINAFSEMCRVAKKTVIISLPNCSARWSISMILPKIGHINFSIPKPRLKAPIHTFDGEHYWEINKSGYELNKVMKEFLKNDSVELVKTYRVWENPYHHFFIFKKI
jgi:SAM-dependent methyltransferase